MRFFYKIWPALFAISSISLAILLGLWVFVQTTDPRFNLLNIVPFGMGIGTSAVSLIFLFILGAAVYHKIIRRHLSSKSY
jgi:hypothetical protein